MLSSLGMLRSAVRSPALASPLRAFTRDKVVYNMIEHQQRAMQVAGRVPNKFVGRYRGPDKFNKYKPYQKLDKKFADPERSWILIDAYGEQLGRLASRLVPLLCGKHKPTYQRQYDQGDYVVVVNAAYVVPSAKAMQLQKYYSHSDYSSGLKVKPLWQLFEDNPTEPLRRALFGMMPKNKLRYQRMSRLRLFPTGEHTQEKMLKAFGAKGFRGIFPPGDGPAVLHRIQPALLEEENP